MFCVMSVASLSLSSSPLFQKKKPSGLVSIAPTICLTPSALLPATRTPDTAVRCPSSIANTIRAEALSTYVVSARTSATAYPLAS